MVRMTIKQALANLISLFDLPYNHKPVVIGGVLENECSQMLSDFFKELREKRKGQKSWKSGE